MDNNKGPTYRYFVSYFWTKSNLFGDKNWGFGFLTMERSRPIDTTQDIMLVQQEAQNGLRGTAEGADVSIISWQRLESL